MYVLFKTKMSSVSPYPYYFLKCRSIRLLLVTLVIFRRLRPTNCRHASPYLASRYFIPLYSILTNLTTPYLYSLRNAEDNEYDDDDNDAADEAEESRSLLKDIADQLKDLGDDESKSGMGSFVAGDMVQIISGKWVGG